MGKKPADSAQGRSAELPGFAQRVREERTVRSTSIGRLFRAPHVIALLAATASALADPVVTHELKHDLSNPLRDVILPAKSGGSLEAQQALPARQPLVSAQGDPVARTPSGALAVSLGLNFDVGAPGQSTLKSGLAISVTRN